MRAGRLILILLLTVTATFPCVGCVFRHRSPGMRAVAHDRHSYMRQEDGTGSLHLSGILRLRGAGDWNRPEYNSDRIENEENFVDDSLANTPEFQNCVFGKLHLGLAETEEEAAHLKFLQDRWNQKIAEWTYCLEGEGRPLNYDPEPYELNGEMLFPIGKDFGWNYDGMNPPPEVWRNPKEEDREAGWRVDPETAPIHELIQDSLRQVQEIKEAEERVRRDGEEWNGQEKDVDGNDCYDYWDRDGGTRPFTNVRSQLPPGWRQLKFCGSTILLNPDGTFVCNDDIDVKDPNLWGQDPRDRGEWRCDGPSWEESQVLTLAFNDEKRHVIELQINCDDRPEGKIWAYTGEDPVLDPPLAEVQPNVWDGKLCDQEDCPRCADEQASDDPNESSSGHVGERIEIPEEVIPGLDELEAKL